MTYHELIELYKENQLEEEKKKKLEADIEKHEAISEYLFEKEESDFGYEGNEFLSKEEKSVQSEEQDFTNKIQKSIRKAFIKLGITVGVIVVAIVFFTIFALPKLVDLFYYDPGKIVADNTNQMSLDMAVYTELYLPGYMRNNVVVNENGYGNYDINITQNVSYNGKMTDVSGKMEKGKLHLYNNNLLKRPVGNSFAWFQFPVKEGKMLSEIYADEDSQMCAAGSVSQASEALEKLDDNERYVAYVTLNRMMPYEDFMQYLSDIGAQNSLGQIWCGVCTDNSVVLYENEDKTAQSSTQEEGYTESDWEIFRTSNIGFNCSFSSSNALNWDRDKYPYLLIWDDASISEGQEWEKRMEQLEDESFMQTHFISMLQYMSDQKEFCSMMEGEDNETLKNAISYVEENGLIIYGFACVADKEALLTLNEQDDIFEIYTQVLQ